MSISLAFFVRCFYYFGCKLLPSFLLFVFFCFSFMLPYRFFKHPYAALSALSLFVVKISPVSLHLFFLHFLLLNLFFKLFLFLSFMHMLFLFSSFLLFHFLLLSFTKTLTSHHFSTFTSTLTLHLFLRNCYL